MLNIVIAGAGISGLAAAISLRRSGHKVTIYEKSALNNEIGAAINVPPNVGRFLIPWGLDPVRWGFVKLTGLYFMSPTTLDELSYFDQTNAAEIYGVPLFAAHRADLHGSLKHLATEPDGPGVPVVVKLKSGVSSYNPETPSITLIDGTTITADVVIAADGVHSTAVEAILGKHNPPQPGEGANCTYRFLIPTEDLETDPETRFFTQSHRSLGCRLFVDNDNKMRLVAYGCRNYEVQNFVAVCYRDDMASETKREDWQASVNKTELLEKFAGFNSGLLAVMNKATEVKRWPLLYRPPIPTWHKGKMALAGDAAHPMLPNQAQGGAQGIEDGLAIGLVLHGVTDASQIEERLAIYEKIRRNRAATIQILSNSGFGDPTGLPEELVGFLEGHPIPTTGDEIIRLAYGADVLQRTIQHMTDFDPSYKIPDDFFPEKK